MPARRRWPSRRCESGGPTRRWDGRCGPRSRPRPRRTRIDGTRHRASPPSTGFAWWPSTRSKGSPAWRPPSESWVECLRLAAAAARLRDETGYRWRFVFEQRRLDAAVAAATEALGPERASAATAEGSALEWREAAAYAGRAHGERQRPSHGWAALTPTELQVVALVADGLTNPQIAERLLMGRATVKTHLDHVFTKTGLHSRTELATEYVRRHPSPSSWNTGSIVRGRSDGEDWTRWSLSGRSSLGVTASRSCSRTVAWDRCSPHTTRCCIGEWRSRFIAAARRWTDVVLTEKPGCWRDSPIRIWFRCSTPARTAAMSMSFSS